MTDLLALLDQERISLHELGQQESETGYVTHLRSLTQPS